MGIAVGKLLKLEYFKDFELLAGSGGLEKEIQGIAILDSPDGFRWGQGKELIISNGYVIRQDPDCVRRGMEEGHLAKASAFFLKIGRYLETLPEGLKELFEAHDIPLVRMPCEMPYMDMMNAVNIAVMNRIMRHLQVRSGPICQMSGMTHKEQTIRHILKVMETEMNFPSYLYDDSEGKAYYSSSKLKQTLEALGLNEKDLLRASQAATTHVICDYTGMKRIRLLNADGSDKNRVSWVQVPILVHDTLQATLVVMESREFLDYYDEYALRIAYVLLQAVYEQIAVARNSGQIGFENFVHALLSWDGGSSEQLEYQAGMQGVHLHDPVYCSVFRERKEHVPLRDKRETLLRVLAALYPTGKIRLVFPRETEGLLLIEKNVLASRTKDLSSLLKTIRQKWKQAFPELDLLFSYSQDSEELLKLSSAWKRGEQLLRIGSVLYPSKDWICEQELGILSWLQIPDDELSKCLKPFLNFREDDRSRELLHTLRVYLESSQNYSSTAQKLFVHINTVRKRIAEAKELLQIDFEDTISCFRLILLLRYAESSDAQ